MMPTARRRDERNEPRVTELAPSKSSRCRASGAFSALV